MWKKSVKKLLEMFSYRSLYSPTEKNPQDCNVKDNSVTEQKAASLTDTSIDPIMLVTTYQIKH